MRFTVLGDVEAYHRNQPIDIGHPQQRRVLLTLLVDANKIVSADQAVERVWGEHPPSRARHALYSYISRLRKVLAAGNVPLKRSCGGYRIEIDPAAIDLHCFQRLLDDANEATDGCRALYLVEQALALWRSEAFRELDTPWSREQRDVLTEQWFGARLLRNDLALGQGLHLELLADLRATAVQYPLDERLGGQLVLALYRCGRRAEALEHCRSLRQQLDQQLGIDPGPELLQLQQQVLIDDRALRITAPAKCGAGRRGQLARTSPPTRRQCHRAEKSSAIGRVAKQ